MKKIILILTQWLKAKLGLGLILTLGLLTAQCTDR